MPHRSFKPTACFDLWLATFHILEMLYPTPFPTEPQTGHIKKDRPECRDYRSLQNRGNWGESRKGVRDFRATCQSDHPREAELNRAFFQLTTKRAMQPPLLLQFGFLSQIRF